MLLKSPSRSSFLANRLCPFCPLTNQTCDVTQTRTFEGQQNCAQTQTAFSTVPSSNWKKASEFCAAKFINCGNTPKTELKRTRGAFFTVLNMRIFGSLWGFNEFFCESYVAVEESYVAVFFQRLQRSEVSRRGLLDVFSS
jgi:hypothetical protein